MKPVYWLIGDPPVLRAPCLTRTLLPALLAAAPAAAGTLDDAPAGYAWGADEARHADMTRAERREAALRVPIPLEHAPFPDAQAHMAVFCEEVGLQQIRTATLRYRRDQIIRRFRAELAALEEALGPHTHGRPEAGTAYWGAQAGLEAWPASKAKFFLLLTRNGPDLDRCES